MDDIFQTRDIHSLLFFLSLNLALLFWIFSSEREIVDLEKKNAKSKNKINKIKFEYLSNDK